MVVFVGNDRLTCCAWRAAGAFCGTVCDDVRISSHTTMGMVAAFARHRVHIPLSLLFGLDLWQVLVCLLFGLGVAVFGGVVELVKVVGDPLRIILGDGGGCRRFRYASTARCSSDER